MRLSDISDSTNPAPQGALCAICSNHPLAFQNIAHAIASSLDSENRVKVYSRSRFSFANAKNEILILDTCSVNVQEIPLHEWHSEGGRTIALVSPDAPAKTEGLRLLCMGVFGIVKFTENLMVSLQSAILAISRGELWVEDGALLEYVRCTSMLLSHISAPDHHLTVREHEIARFLSQGSSNAQIATALCISQRTVKFHISNLLKKCDAESRWEFLSESATKRLTTKDSPVASANECEDASRVQNAAPHRLKAVVATRFP